MNKHACTLRVIVKETPPLLSLLDTSHPWTPTTPRPHCAKPHHTLTLINHLNHPSSHHCLRSPSPLNLSPPWTSPQTTAWTPAPPNSAIHKAASLIVPGRSLILPGTIPETPISPEWSRWLERPRGGPSNRRPDGFVNSAVNARAFHPLAAFCA